MRNIVLQDPITVSLTDAWQNIRVSALMPYLYVSFYACAILSTMLFAERIQMTAVILWVKLSGIERYTKSKLEVLQKDMEENKSHPMVLIQIPMFNEREV